MKRKIKLNWIYMKCMAIQFNSSYTIRIFFSTFDIIIKKFIKYNTIVLIS